MSARSWWSVVLVEEPEDPEKTTDLSQATDKLCRIMLYRVHLIMNGVELTTSVVIGTDYTVSFKFNYRMNTSKTVPKRVYSK